MMSVTEAGRPAPVADNENREHHARRKTKFLGPLCLVVVAAIVGAAGSEAFLGVAITAVIFAIAGQGLTVLSGPVKVISIASSAFVGIGAFVVGYFTLTSGTDLLVALPVGMAACAAVGLLVAPIAGKVSGIQIAIITVGIAFLAQHIFRIARPWTGGNDGLQILEARLGGLDLNSDLSLGAVSVGSDLLFFIVCVAILLATSVATDNLLHSRPGRALRMTGTSVLGAKSFGIKPGTYRSIAFAYAAVLGGLSGGLLAVRQGYIVWDQFGGDMSIDLLAVVVLGGLGSVYGAIAGAVVVYALPEVIQRLSDSLPLVAASGDTHGITPGQLTSVIYGLLLVVVMVYEPGGIAGIAARVGGAVRSLRRQGGASR